MNNIFPSQSDNFTMLIVGARRSGKSFMLLNQLLPMYKEQFDLIYIVTPSRDFDNFDLNPMSGIFDTYSTELLQVLFRQQEEMFEEDNSLKSLVILDDCISADNFKSLKEANIINLIATRGRHVGISLIITTQNYKSVSPSLRINSDVVIWFERNSARKLYEEREVVENYKKFREIVSVATAKIHGYLVLTIFDRELCYYYDPETKEFFSISLN